jgi:hypothetical protein
MTDDLLVDILLEGEWEGPFKVTGEEGRTDEHIVLYNPKNGTVFEHYFDGSYNTRPHQKED